MCLIALDKEITTSSLSPQYLAIHHIPHLTARFAFPTLHLLYSQSLSFRTTSLMLVLRLLMIRFELCQPI